MPEENQKNLVIKSYNSWKAIFEGIEVLTFIGKLELKEFESITSPISTQIGKRTIKLFDIYYQTEVDEPEKVN